MSANDAWAHTPRQYRPHGYPPHLPQSISMSSINEEPNASNPEIPTRHIPASTRYNRRRTDNSIPLPRPVFPSVATSRLTASVSSNEVGQAQPRFPTWLVDDRIHTPSRIPTPVLRKSPSKSPLKVPVMNARTPVPAKSPMRHASTPVLPSQKSQKEVGRSSDWKLDGSLMTYYRIYNPEHFDYLDLFHPLVIMRHRSRSHGRWACFLV